MSKASLTIGAQALTPLCNQNFLASHELSHQVFKKKMDRHTIYNAIRIIAMQCTYISTNFLQRFVYSQDRFLNFNDHKMNQSCVCVCCATIRMMLSVSPVILQRFTILDKSFGLSFPGVATSKYWIQGYFCPVMFHLLLTVLSRLEFTQTNLW